jgi:hypothetical protein
MEASSKRIFWSDESARIYGYPPGTEPTPELILQRVHPEDVDLLKSVLERAGQGGSDFDFEHRLLLPDGSIKHINNLSRSYRDEAGNEEVVGAIMDITERRVAEETIWRSKAYLTEAQELSHTGSWGWRPESGEIAWSDETYRIFGYDRAETPNMAMVFERIHPDDRTLMQRIIDGISQNTNFEHEYRLVMPTGVLKYVHVRGRTLFDSSGKLEVVGAVTDITERKAFEDKVREEEVAFRQILDFTPHYLAVFGSDGTPIYANRTSLDYIGMSLDEWRHRTGIDEECHPDDLQRVILELSRAVATGSPVEMEERVRTRDGSFRW